MSEIRWKSQIVAISYQTSYIKIGLPGGSADKESACNAGDLGSIPGLGRSPGEGKVSWQARIFQYPGLENSMDCMYSPWGRKELDTT